MLNYFGTGYIIIEQMFGKGVDARMTSSDSEFMKEISQTEIYKALSTRYNASMDSMETAMSKDHFQMMLEHERILFQLITYLNTEENKHIKQGEINFIPIL